MYHLVCKSEREECRRAHYVGMASTTKSNVKPMHARWANHKSHHKKGVNKCKMTEHLITWHKNEAAQDLLSITILEKCNSVDEALEAERKWSYNLFSYYPCGLNLREEKNPSS